MASRVSVAAVLSLVAFLGGLIHYAIENNRIAHDYLLNYTNAAFIVKKGLKLPEDGLYSGFDSAEGTYDKSTWIIRKMGQEKGEKIMSYLVVKWNRFGKRFSKFDAPFGPSSSLCLTGPFRSEGLRSRRRSV